MVTKCMDDGWTNTDRQCIHKSKLRCHHPSDPHVHLTFAPDDRVFVYCDMGFAIFDAGGSLVAKPEVTCSPNAQYRSIGFPSISCQVVQCNNPVVNGPHTVMTSQWYHSYATIVDVRCDDGYNFSPLDGTQQSPLMMSYTCNGVGGWFPDPTGFTCQRIDCGEPPSVMGIMMSYNATNLNDEVIYRCRGNKSFGESEALTSVCSTNGKWSPDPRTRACGYHKCSVPAPPPFATLSIERYGNTGNTSNTGNTGGLQELRITCDEGYKIFNSSQTISIMCDKTGQWTRSITEYPCEVVRCNPPHVPLMAIHPPLEELYTYNDIITFTCTPRKWFVPGGSFKLDLRCSQDGWFPHINYTCADIYCTPPPILHHATLEYDGLKVGSDATYECMAGYWMRRGVTKRTTSCHGNARWNPHPLGGDMECKEITCETPPHMNGSHITSNITQYKVGVNVTYQCNGGRWFSKGEVVRNVTCVHGSWQPSPHAIIVCGVIHCDTLPPVEGARVDGYGTKVGSNVTYTCVHGKHFREYKLRRLGVVCGGEGGWIPQPENLKCYDVFCEELSVGGASKSHENREIGSSVELTCPHTTWFTRGQRSMIVTCTEDGRWLPHVGGVGCKVVDCGRPNINNIIPSHNYSYTSEVTIQCQHGYNINPPGHASVVCDESGVWFPNPQYYRCIPVSCDLPRYIRHATVAGATTFNNTLIVTCDPGFHIRAGVNKVRSTCLADRTWDVNLNTINCISFTCKDPGYIARSTRESLSSHLMHGAMYKFVCEHGYWVDGLYNIVVVCSLAGAWEPAVNFTCTEIRCSHPPMKVKSTLIINGGENKTDYAIDQTMRYECDDHSWLTAQYDVTEWTFTGLSDVTMTCKVTGQWYPHPDSFACRDIMEGSVPVGYPRGLPGKKVLFGYWKRPLGGSNHTYSVAVSTGLLTWHGV
ncbi:sushi, von Willebrand factor type A, EGF and pentraxin domain-containing protein 1-like [Ciona intestinalis]